MTKIVGFLDPRFEKFRKTPVEKVAKPEKSREEKPRKAAEPAEKLPQTEEELVSLLRRVPDKALSIRDRNLIAGAMSFKSRRASLVMHPCDDITFIREKDFLGPVMLDKLYKTGDTVFPVMNTLDKVCGLLRLDKLDPKKIGKSDTVAKFMEHKIAFARMDYTLEQLLAVFLRANTDYVLIIDAKEKLRGYADLDTLIAVLFNREIKDDFDNDDSSTAVALRQDD